MLGEDKNVKKENKGERENEKKGEPNQLSENNMYVDNPTH